MIVRRFSRVFLAALFCLLGSLLLIHTPHRRMRWNVIAASMPEGTETAGDGMAHMAGHMYMTALRAPQAEDQQPVHASPRRRRIA